MATPPKRWPNHAEWARLDAISLAQDSLALLDELLDELEEPEQIRKVARLMNWQRKIDSTLQTAKK